MLNNPFILTLIISLAIQIFFFSFAAWFKTDKVTDLSYGLSFVILALFLLFKNQTFFLYQNLVTLIIALWGIRLASYLVIRILKTKRDKRFDGIRENFWKFAQFWFFQAIAVWIISLPSSYLLSLNINRSLTGLMFLGTLTWLIGITIETIADAQKFAFKSKPENRDLWIQTGVWKFSRHPNYFGEMLCWWGIFIISIPMQQGLTWLSMIGPIFITSLLLFGTGIPTIENKYNKKYKDNEDYQSYKKSTNLLIPGLKKIV